MGTTTMMGCDAMGGTMTLGHWGNWEIRIAIRIMALRWGGVVAWLWTFLLQSGRGGD